MWLLVGVVILIIGLSLKQDTIAVVLIAGIVTGCIAGLPFLKILAILGDAFVGTRYMTLLLLTLAVIGILERNGLREQSAFLVSKIEGATCGKILSVYLVLRTIAAIFSLRLGGAVQFIRPIVFPMAYGAAEKELQLSEKEEDHLKGLANAMDNLGNFFGQNVFIASAGVLLIVGTFSELGTKHLDPYSVAKASIPMAIIMMVIAIIRNYIFDKKLRKEGHKK